MRKCRHTGSTLLSWESGSTMFRLWAELAKSSHEHQLLERTTDRKTMGRWQVLLKTEWTVPVFQGKQLIVVVPHDKIQAFYQKETLGKHLTSRAQFHKYLKTFLMRSVIFLILCHEICQYLEDPHNSANIQYFKTHSKCKRDECILVKQRSNSSLSQFQDSTLY